MLHRLLVLLEREANDRQGQKCTAEGLCHASRIMVRWDVPTPLCTGQLAQSLESSLPSRATAARRASRRCRRALAQLVFFALPPSFDTTVEHIVRQPLV